MGEEILESITGERCQHVAHMLSLPAGFAIHTVRECTVCGNLQWKGSRYGAVPTIEIVALGETDQPCHVCASAYARNPELVAWVMSVLQMRERKNRRELERK